MANISMENATLEIEPFKSLIYSTASPFSFPLDQFTIGYLCSRYIVLHCIPLREERYLALPANIQVKQAVSSPDGEFLALLELIEKQAQISIYSMSQLKKVSTIVLNQDDIPTRFGFAQQTRYLILQFPDRFVSLAWQRAQADDIVKIPVGSVVFKFCHFTQKQLAATDSQNQISFQRQTESGVTTSQATKLPRVVEEYYEGEHLKIVDFLWMTSSLLVAVMDNGELLVFNPPRFLGFIRLPRGQTQSDSGLRESLVGKITCCASLEKKIVVGTTAGETACIELNNDSDQLFQNDDQDQETQKTEPSRAMGGVMAGVFPHRIVGISWIPGGGAISQVSMHESYALVESNENLFVWNTLAPKILVGGKSYTYTADVKKIVKDDYRKNFKTVQLTDEVRQVYEDILPKPLQQEMEILLQAELREEVTDVAAMSTLLTLQNAFYELGDAQLFGQQANNQLDAQLKLVDKQLEKIERHEQGASYQPVVDTDVRKQRPFPKHLNNDTDAAVWSDLLTGCPAINLPLYALKQFESGPRTSLQKQSLVPCGFRQAKPITIRNIANVSVSEPADIMVFSSITTVYAAYVQSCSVFTSLDIGHDIEKLQMHPQGNQFFAQYSEGVGYFVITDEAIQMVSFTVFKGISLMKLSNGGGILAVVCDKGVQPIIKLIQTHNMQLFAELKCHNAHINFIEFLPGDATLASSSVDGIFYGHNVGTLERVFETILRGVKLIRAKVLVGKQFDSSYLSDDIAVADDTKQAKHDYMQKNSEQFIICGVDADNKYYEIANGRQLHQIELLNRHNFMHFLTVPSPPRNWSSGYLKAISEQNIEKTVEDGTVTTLNFGKEMNAVEQKTEEQVAVPKAKPAEFKEERNYFKLTQEIGNTRAEEFSERMIKFLMAFDDTGCVSCYEWPLRNGAAIITIKLHEKPIKEAQLMRGSVLITVSEDSLLISNIRFLVPAQAIFGANVRNRVLNRLKMVYDNPSTKLLLRLPVTRFDPVFMFETAVKSLAKATEVNSIAYQIVQNMAQVWNYTDFRINTLRDMVRQRKKRAFDALSKAKATSDAKMKPIKQQSEDIELELAKAEVLFKNKNSELYKQLQTKYAPIIQGVKAQIQEMHQKIDALKNQHTSTMDELSRKRNQEILSETNRRAAFLQEKELEIDRLDENLAQFETALAEELKQADDERVVALNTIKDAIGKTISREQSASSALQGWYSLQERKMQTLKQQKIEVQTETEIENKKLQQYNQELADVNSQCQQQKEIIQGKDRELLTLEGEIENIKRGLFDLNKGEFVLSHQIDELKSEIRPRDDLLQDMRERATELSRKLEDSQQEWSKLQRMIEDCTKQVDELNAVNKQAAIDARKRELELVSLKKEFEVLISDLDPTKWFLAAFEMNQKHRTLYDELQAAEKKSEATKSNAVIKGEIDEQRVYLNSKLNNLYADLDKEDVYFDKVQAYALDENQALLQEAHRLKEENLNLNEQLQKISAMLQAIKVKDLTLSLKQQVLQRNQRQEAETLKRTLEGKYGSNIEEASMRLMDQNVKVKEVIKQVKK